MGMGRYSKHEDHNITWWIVSSKNKPSHDEALNILMTELNTYEQEDFASLLVVFKDELGIDLNNVNIFAEQRIQDLWQRKFIPKLEKLLDINYKELVELWNKNDLRVTL